MELNLRFFLWLLLKKADIICAVDLDTILPCLLVSIIKKTKRIYDAHELFTEQKEIVTRPVIHSIWRLIERITVPYFKTAYTVNKFIADKLCKQYGNIFFVIRNMPVYYEHLPSPDFCSECFFIYQGAVNHGRSFETLIPAMQFVNAKLVICGIWNFFAETKSLIHHYHLEEKIEMRGNLLPADQRTLTCNAYAGITIFEPVGLNQIHSLCNRFFDYIMAGIPQVCCNYPEYKHLNKIHKVARLTASVEIPHLAIALNHLFNDEKCYFELKENCRHAKEE
ncbi:MAG: glycosyltransferase family 4 protein [Chitinophagaceae bacterium]|nr:glycosyltransferase family 4 protein [Chitinophagaceae bacterium]